MYIQINGQTENHKKKSAVYHNKKDKMRDRYFCPGNPRRTVRSCRLRQGYPLPKVVKS